MAIYWIGFIIILIVLAGAAFVTARYLRDLRAARRRLDSLGSQVIETACGPIECTIVGEGFPVLIVHGALGGFDQGLFLARAGPALTP